jgi:hypothetical protein
MINFSPFGRDSRGLVTAAGLGLSFSAAGLAARRTPMPQKSVKETTIRMKMDLLNLSSMVPPKIKI